MNFYLIGYDLNSRGQEYKNLEKTINSLGKAWKILETTWILTTTHTLDELSNRLVSADGKDIDENDNLLIIEVKEKKDFFLKKKDKITGESTAHKIFLSDRKHLFLGDFTSPQ